MFELFVRSTDDPDKLVVLFKTHSPSDAFEAQEAMIGQITLAMEHEAGSDPMLPPETCEFGIRFGSDKGYAYVECVDYHQDGSVHLRFPTRLIEVRPARFLVHEKQ